MRIAYLIATHSDPAQLANLIRSLMIPDVTTFYIHVDLKAPIESFIKAVNESIEDNLRTFVHFTSNRYNVTWGTFTQCYYQLELINTCLNSNIEYDRVVFLSGLDYPLMSNDEILNFWTIEKNREWIAGVNISQDGIEALQKRKINKKYFPPLFLSNTPFYRYVRKISYCVLSPLLSLISPKKPYIDLNGRKLPIYYGSSWWGITGKCLKAIQSILNNPSYQNYFKTALFPDELFIQTAVYNSEYSKNTIGGYYTVPISLGRNTPLHHIEYKQYIKIWTDADWNEVSKLKKMFLRKVVSGESGNLIGLIDAKRR